MGAKRPVRRVSVLLHRWAGLVLGAWLAVAGLSGTVLVWHAELDRALNPQWFALGDSCHNDASSTPVADALRMVSRQQRGRPVQVMRPEVPDAAWVVWTKLGARRVQHFVDPRCGRYLGLREWGAPRIDRAHAVPALYELHRALLAGDTGHAVVGVGGAWLLAIVISGLVNAWPPRSSGRAWARALSVKCDTGRPRLFYDLHRAAGLWLAPFLMLMSLTGLYLCFPDPTRRIVSALLPMQPPASLQKVTSGPVQGPDALVGLAQAHWASAAWTRLQLPKRIGDPVEVRLLQSGEIRRDTGDTRLKLAADGRVLDVRDPLRAPAGDRLLGWLFPLHSGEAFGLAGRLFWTVSGCVPALLLVTGTWLWWRRRVRSAYVSNVAALRSNSSDGEDN